MIFLICVALALILLAVSPEIFGLFLIIAIAFGLFSMCF
jgi:hypothetical protein